MPSANPARPDDLSRIRHALMAAGKAARSYTPGSVEWTAKSERGDPLTEADLMIDGILERMLRRPGEGWLSEETVDDGARLNADYTWIVDPLDGTREFVEGIPEWCISIGLVRRGVPIAGGIFNPSTDELILGAPGHGVTLNGELVSARDPNSKGGRDRLAGARILASRSEVRRGEWEHCAAAGFDVIPCGSVAYKLGLVAAGRADATWTLVPKNEWDVAGGAALIRAAGLHHCLADGSERRFNQVAPKLPNFLAGPRSLLESFRADWI